MISRIGRAEDVCSAEDFASADNDLPLCQHFDDGCTQYIYILFYFLFFVIA